MHPGPVNFPGSKRCSRGADVNVKGPGGVTLLMEASNAGRLDVVQALLAAKVDVNAKADNGATALMIASQNGHLEVVRALLAANADVNTKPNDGATALMIASAAGHLDVVQLLTASVPLPDKWGLFPCCASAIFRSLEGVAGPRSPAPMCHKMVVGEYYNERSRPSCKLPPSVSILPTNGHGHRCSPL